MMVNMNCMDETRLRARGVECMDAFEQFMGEDVRCKRCGQTQTRNQWCEGAADGCEDNECPMKEYQP